MILAIDEAKFPPPKPVSAARLSMIQNSVDGSANAMEMPPVGISKSNAEITVQLRPPKRATMNV